MYLQAFIFKALSQAVTDGETGGREMQLVSRRVKINLSELCSFKRSCIVLFSQYNSPFYLSLL